MSIKINLPTNTDVLKKKALLVRLTRKKMSRNKMDKDLSIMVKDQKNVTEDGAVRVNKSIFTKASTDSYMKIYNEASKYFYRVTLPWDEKGFRLMSVEIYEDFTKKFKDYTSKYRAVVNQFIEAIESHVADARIMLGDAFKEEDYKFLTANGGVDKSWLDEQFTLEVEFNTITGKDDLRAVLTEDDREAIADAIEAQSMAKFAKSQEHVIVSLVDCIRKLHERLCDSENVFRDTLTGNLEDLCDLVPKMNIGGDPALNRIAEECKAQLCKWDPQTLRDNDDKRQEVSDAANDILKQAEGLI